MSLVGFDYSSKLLLQPDLVMFKAEIHCNSLVSCVLYEATLEPPAPTQKRVANWFGQIIFATSHDQKPQKRKRNPLFHGNLGWWNFLIWPESSNCNGDKKGDFLQQSFGKDATARGDVYGKHFHVGWHIFIAKPFFGAANKKSTIRKTICSTLVDKKFPFRKWIQQHMCWCLKIHWFPMVGMVIGVYLPIIPLRVRWLSPI